LRCTCTAGRASKDGRAALPSILRGSPKRLAPPATTAKPLRRDDGYCGFDCDAVLRTAMPGHDEFLSVFIFHHIASRSRRAFRASFAINCAPSLVRGSGECRGRAAPAVSCAKCIKESAHEHTGSAEALRHSLRNGFTAYAALSPATNSSCHRRCRLDGYSIRSDRCRHRQLDTSNGCQDHTVLPYASAPFVLRAVNRSRIKDPPCDHLARRRRRVHRIPPHVRDDRERPSGGRDGGSYTFDLPDGMNKKISLPCQKMTRQRKRRPTE
jgi:hypothetical protein